MTTPPVDSNLRRYLEQEFARRRKKNPRYSMRSFARDLELDATALSRILAGTRAIGAKTAQKILSHLNVSPTTRSTLLHSLIAPEENTVPIDADYSELTQVQMERMGEWYYSAILELARSKSARLDVPTLAKYFGLSITETEGAIKTLLELGLLKRTEHSLRYVGGNSTTPYKKNSPALTRIITGYIEQAKEAQLHHAEDSHQISGTTVLISRSKLAEAGNRIKEFRRSLATFLETDMGEDLYRLNIQLFSLKKSNS